MTIIINVIIFLAIISYVVLHYSTFQKNPKQVNVILVALNVDEYRKENIMTLNQFDRFINFVKMTALKSFILFDSHHKDKIKKLYVLNSCKDKYLYL